MDSIYASREDFNNMKNRDRARGLHLLEYFVTRCHQIGVIFILHLLEYFISQNNRFWWGRLLAKHGSRKVIRRKLSVMKWRGSSQISLLWVVEDLDLSSGMLSPWCLVYLSCSSFSFQSLDELNLVCVGTVKLNFSFKICFSQGFCWNREWILREACWVPCYNDQA